MPNQNFSFVLPIKNIAFAFRFITIYTTYIVDYLMIFI